MLCLQNHIPRNRGVLVVAPTLTCRCVTNAVKRQSQRSTPPGGRHDEKPHAQPLNRRPRHRKQYQTNHPDAYAIQAPPCAWTSNFTGHCCAHSSCGVSGDFFLMVGVMYEARQFEHDYQVGNGTFQFRALSKADAKYLRDLLNSMTREQHLKALKGEDNDIPQ